MIRLRLAPSPRATRSSRHPEERSDEEPLFDLNFLPSKNRRASPSCRVEARNHKSRSRTVSEMAPRSALLSRAGGFVGALASTPSLRSSSFPIFTQTQNPHVLPYSRHKKMPF